MNLRVKVLRSDLYLGVTATITLYLHEASMD